MDTPDLSYTRVDNTWLFDDGTVLPVVSGGEGPVGAPEAPAPAAPAPDINAALDAIEARETAAPAPEPAPETMTPAAPAPAAPTAQAADPEPDPFDTGADSFDRAYVEKLRQESARYRTAAKPFAETFDGVDEGDRDAFLGLVELYKADPAAAAEWMKSNAEALLAGAPAPEAPPAGDEPPLTRAQLDQVLAEREAAKQREATVQGVHKQVADLGLDPATRAGKELMLRALEDHQGDIAAAHKALTDEKAAADKAVIEKYLADKEAGANGPSPVPQTGAAGEASNPPKSIKEAKAALEARFDALGFK